MKPRRVFPQTCVRSIRGVYLGAFHDMQFRVVLDYGSTEIPLASREFEHMFSALWSVLTSE
jgi:hypothetical protein